MSTKSEENDHISRIQRKRKHEEREPLETLFLLNGINWKPASFVEEALIKGSVLTRIEILVEKKSVWLNNRKTKEKAILPLKRRNLDTSIEVNSRFPNIIQIIII
jgi:hypothetical protein